MKTEFKSGICATGVVLFGVWIWYHILASMQPTEAFSWNWWKAEAGPLALLAFSTLAIWALCHFVYDPLSLFPRWKRRLWFAALFLACVGAFLALTSAVGAERSLLGPAE